MKKLLVTVALIFTAATASAIDFPVEQYCEDNYLDKYGYSQVEYCVNKQSKALENLTEIYNKNGWRDEFLAIYERCEERSLADYGPSQVEYCIQKDMKAWNRMNPYEKMEL